MASTSVTREFLANGIGDGIGQKVTGTATGSTVLVHTSGSTSPVAGHKCDEVYLWAYNDDASADVLLTLEIGGTTVPDNLIRDSIPARAGKKLVLSGMAIGTSITIKAFAGTANVVVLYGYVDRMVEQ